MHIYLWQINPTPSSKQAQISGKPLQCTYTYCRFPPPIKDRWLEYHYTKLGRSTPLDHRCLEYHYTQLGKTTGRFTPQKWSIYAMNTTTPNLADLLADLHPLAIKHRCLEYCYNKHGISTVTPHQSSIDAFNTATPNLADLHHTAIEYTCLKYATPNLGRSTPPTEHRCFEYCYTKLGRSTSQQSSIDAFNTAKTCQIYAPHQSSIHALHTVTPNLADLPPRI